MKRTQLFLQMQEDPEAAEPRFERSPADGWVLESELASRLRPPPAEEHGCWVLMDCDPARHPGWDQFSNTAWVTQGSLEDLARLRDRSPSLRWIPVARVYRPRPRFEFRQQFHEEGFKTYVPDLTTYRRFHVAEAKSELGAWLERAGELGYGCVWLHGLEAAARGAGLDLEMIERGRSVWTGELWVSGGANEERHLQTLAEEGSTDAVIVPASVGRRCGILPLRRALAPRLKVEIGESTGTIAGAGQQGAHKPCAPPVART